MMAYIDYVLIRSSNGYFMYADIFCYYLSKIGRPNTEEKCKVKTKTAMARVSCLLIQKF